MIGITLKGTKGPAKLARALEKRALRIGPEQARAMSRLVLKMEANLKRDTLSAKGGSSSFFGKTGAKGDRLATVTGHTKRTIVTRVFARLLTVVGVIGSPLKSFAAHEFGATIRGRPYLRIPTRWMKTPSGADRLAGRSARTLPGTNVHRSKRGNLFVWDDAGRPLYLLKLQVELRPRHMLRNLLRSSRSLIRASVVGGWARVMRGE